MIKTKTDVKRLELKPILRHLEDLFRQAVSKDIPIGKFYYQLQALQYNSRYSLYKDKRYKELIIQTMTSTTSNEVRKILHQVATLLDFSMAQYPKVKVLDEIVARIRST